MTDVKQVRQILEKEVLSFWDFKTMLEYMAEALSNGKTEDFAGLRLLQEPVSVEIQDYVSMITNQTASTVKMLDKFQSDLIAALTKSYNNYEAQWNAITAKIHSLHKKMDAENFEFPQIKIPHQWKEYFDFAERLANMTPESRDAFIDFAKKMHQ